MAPLRILVGVGMVAVVMKSFGRSPKSFSQPRCKADESATNIPTNLLQQIGERSSGKRSKKETRAGRKNKY